MADKIKLEIEDFIKLIEFEDSVYGKIWLCSNQENKKFFVIDNIIVKDERIISEINKKYGLEIPKKLQNTMIG